MNVDQTALYWRICYIIIKPQFELNQTNAKESHARSYFDIFWSTPRNIGVGLCQLAQQSRAEVIQSSSQFALRTVIPTNVATVRNSTGILCSKKKHLSPHFLGMPEKCEEKVFLFRNMSLTLRNNEAILYVEIARVEYSSLRESLNTAPACSSRARNTQFKDKPDMIEANTTYLWQTPYSVDSKSFCASAPASSTNNIHADTGISMPVSAFFVPEHTPFCFPRLS